MKKIKRTLVYKNSDGFLTEDKKQYQEREKLLKKIEKQGATGVSSPEIQLWYWNKPKAERDRRDALDKLIAQDKKNACGCCGGSGSIEEYGCFGRETNGCSECDGTGLKESYRKRTGRKHYLEGTWYSVR